MGCFTARGTSVSREPPPAGIPYCLSTVSTTRLEDVAAKAGGRLWMQLYVLRNRAIAEDIMRRAENAGYEALVFTHGCECLRQPRMGSPKLSSARQAEPAHASRHHETSALVNDDVIAREGMPRFHNLEPFLSPQQSRAVGGSTVLPPMFDASICWEDIAWIRRFWPRKLLIKGVLSVGDAKQAFALGCDGIVLSNHGGRQLDYCVAPIEMLSEIVEAVGRKLTIIVDSGFRRGTDIVKALALGADAVMLGRAVLYGLIAGGESGVDRSLQILTSEMDRVLGQLGCRSVEELGPHLLRHC